MHDNFLQEEDTVESLKLKLLDKEAEYEVEKLTLATTYSNLCKIPKWIRKLFKADKIILG